MKKVQRQTNKDHFYTPGSGFGKNDFDFLEPSRRGRVTLSHANDKDIFDALDLASTSIASDLAPLDTIRRVVARNPDNLLIFRRKDVIVGAWAMLLLRKAGIDALVSGQLDPSNPENALLSPPDETPAAIYVWAIVAPGLAVEGVWHVSAYLRQPRYASVDIYTRAATTAGAMMINSTGCRRIGENSDLFKYERFVNRIKANSDAA
jgi:hypothetical protein